MAVKLYVGGLSYSTSVEELRRAFEGIGTVVSANVIMDRMTGQSRGFGFVEMGSPEEAHAAISKLDGSTLGDRTIKVNEARPPAQRTGGGGGGFGGGGGGRGRRPGGGGQGRW